MGHIGRPFPRAPITPFWSSLVLILLKQYSDFYELVVDSEGRPWDSLCLTMVNSGYSYGQLCPNSSLGDLFLLFQRCWAVIKSLVMSMDMGNAGPSTHACVTAMTGGPTRRFHQKEEPVQVHLCHGQ